MVDYPHVIIGSSPVCALEAAFLNRTDRDVLVIDKASRPGGHWSVIDLPVCDKVENGPHYFQDYPPTYQLLSETFGIDFQPYDIPPETVLPRPIFGRDKWPRHANGWTTGTDGVGFPRSVDQLKTFIIPYLRFCKQRIKRVFRINKDYSPCSPQFPEGGMVELIQKIETFLRDSDIDTLFNHEVTGIEIDSQTEKATVELSSDSIRTKNVVLTSNSTIPKIKAKHGEPVELPDTTENHVQVYLFIQGGKSRPFSFLGFTDADYLQLVQDCTAYCRKNQVEDSVVLTARLQLEPEQINDETGAEVLDILKTHGYFCEEATIQNQFSRNFPSPQYSKDTLTRVENKCAPMIHTLYSSSLILCIKNNWERWKILVNET